LTVGQRHENHESAFVNSVWVRELSNESRSLGLAIKI